MFSLCQSVSSASNPMHRARDMAGDRGASGPCAAAEAVEEDCDDDHEADDDLLEIVGPAHLLRPVAQDRHDERADHRAQDGARAAAQACAADDDCSYDVE